MDIPTMLDQGSADLEKVIVCGSGPAQLTVKTAQGTEGHTSSLGRGGEWDREH